MLADSCSLKGKRLHTAESSGDDVTNAVEEEEFRDDESLHQHYGAGSNYR